MTGYLHPMYAASLSKYGIPIELSRSRTWILKRPIPGTSAYDGMGCYPLFVCQDWSQLPRDLEELSSEVIALSLVTDPFGSYEEDFLKKCFVDIVRPFKKHFVVNLKSTPESYVSKHHARNIQKALQHIRVERCKEPLDYFESWINLYSTLVERHDIQGMTVFSRESFAQQFQVPGLVAFRAVYRDETVGMLLWYVQGNVGYYHLGAHSPLGYELLDSFALFQFAIEYFSTMGLCWLNLGAGAGLNSDGTDGLTRFKRGWSTGTRTAYFCGRIFDRVRYREIVNSKHVSSTSFFPAYRHGEF